MGVTIVYDMEAGIIRARLFGDFSLEEFGEKFDRMMDSSNVPRGADAIWDTRDMDFSSLDPYLMNRIITLREQYRADRNRAWAAIVANPNNRAYFRKLYEMMPKATAERIKVFSQTRDAERWIYHARDQARRATATSG